MRALWNVEHFGQRQLAADLRVRQGGICNRGLEDYH